MLEAVLDAYQPAVDFTMTRFTRRLLFESLRKSLRLLLFTVQGKIEVTANFLLPKQQT